MYAVIETGGRQYRVELGSEIELDQLDAEPGSTIELGRVLLVADGEDAHIGRPVVDGARVTADVLRHDRGDKIIVFKYQPKARRRVKRGHRSELTLVRVSDIVFGERSAAKDAQTQADKEAAARAAAEKEAARKAAADQELAAKLAAEEAAKTEAEQAAAEGEQPETGRKRATRTGTAKAPAKSTAEAPARKSRASAETDAGEKAGAAESATTEQKPAAKKAAAKKPAARKPAGEASETSSKRNRKDE